MTASVNTGLLVSIVVGQPATFDQAGYEALSYTLVGEVVSVGEYGATTEVVNHQPLATGVTEKFKGFINYGQASLGLAYQSDDAGQVILKDLSDGANRLSRGSMKVTYPEGNVDYLDVGVFSYTKNPGAANSIIASTVAIEVNRAAVEVAAP